MRYEVYELRIRDHAGRETRALAEFQPGADKGTVRSIWDDTKSASWPDDFGWMPLLPSEAIDVHRVDLRGALPRPDLTEAFAGRGER